MYGKQGEKRTFGHRFLRHADGVPAGDWGVRMALVAGPGGPGSAAGSDAAGPRVAAVEMPEVRLPAVETLEPAPVPVPVPPKETKELPEVEVDHTPVAAEAPRLVVAPLRGDVLTAFSMEELVYSPTLGDWRTHNGVDIAAQQGTTVLAASAGAVLSVTDDPLMGTTVVLEHDNGYQTTYANLQAKPNVEAGDPVSAGQIIGAVGTTAAAESGQPHLHFAVTKDGKAVDPNEYLSG